MTTKITIENPEGNEAECVIREVFGVADGKIQATTTIVPAGATTSLHVYPSKEVHIYEQFKGNVHG